MILLALVLAFAIGAAITYWIITPLQRAVWRRHDLRVAERIDQQTQRLDAMHRRWAEEDRRLLGEVRQVCESGLWR